VLGCIIQIVKIGDFPIELGKVFKLCGLLKYSEKVLFFEIRFDLLHSLANLSYLLSELPHILTDFARRRADIQVTFCQVFVFKVLNERLELRIVFVDDILKEFELFNESLPLGDLTF
jgi:hypothetical protein